MRKHTLFVINHFTAKIEKVCDLDQNSETIRHCANLSHTFESIVSHQQQTYKECKHNHIALTSVDNFRKVFSTVCSDADFIKTSNIIAAFAIDLEESDYYFVVET